ncbi:prevent-host-death family protein [Shimia gijangensis]|uniref:Antitoxin n=1 Tax=Shimia gijangensis TaxID=1470563 RepID=A0A1M6Q4C7_9RHOB|nr:type II toxin-antitoxin system Phd/YefM family antitoxin [Shimia gijangensis]SHK15040.1 prevent-host-death family protein [Shimia gijangensis]
MRLPISAARSRLGQLCTRVQDPRETILLTRHDKPVAAIVSIAEVTRIWDLQEIEEHGVKNPLSGRSGPCLLRGFVPGLNGDPVTPREAALQMQKVQMTRAAERGILATGGLEPVEGGEVEVTVRKGWRRWFWWRSTR